VGFEKFTENRYFGKLAIEEALFRPRISKQRMMEFVFCDLFKTMSFW
jgi:hypothetical protein